jgi:GH24 family phage-related lysozyme (muramidase)
MIKNNEGQGKNGLGCMYHDSKGIPTVCHGMNLRNGNAASRIGGVGGNFSGVMGGSSCLSSSQCQSLFNQDFNTAKTGANKLFGNTLDKCQAAKDVATDMTFNMGSGSSGLGGFNVFNSLMKQGKWGDAANDLKGTKWCGQVGGRCDRNVAMIRSCMH